MKRIITSTAAVLLLVSLGSCAPGKKGYEDALDTDRQAREKMTTALGLMRDVSTILEQAGSDLTESENGAVESKRAEAIDAFVVALESWEEAVEIYEQLIADYPDEPVYLNNLANLIYNKAHSGLEADLARARDLLEKAIGMTEREIFKRNLALIGELEDNTETQTFVAENREIVAELKQLVSERED